MNNDLISRSALLELVQFRLPIDNYNAEVISGCVDITRRLIENAPAVDAVEVVRCKDCKNGKRCIDGYVQCSHPSGKRILMKSFDFCSYGERKEN